MIPGLQRRRHLNARTALAAAVLAASATTALADNLTWTGSAAGNTWSDPANWLNSAGTPATPANSDNLFFDAAPTVVVTNNDLTGLSINGGTFTATAASFTLNGNNLTLSGQLNDLSTNAQTINLPLTLNGSQTIFVDSGGLLTINGQISENGGSSLTKSGAGVLALGANNTYSGDTILNGGTLKYLADNTNVHVLTFGSTSGSTVTSSANLAAANVTATGLTARTNSATANTITIGDGKTLTVNGATSVGTGSANFSTLVNITGSTPGTGSFVVNAGGANFTVGLSVASTDGSGAPATLDMTGLGTFIASGNGFNIAATGNQRSTGTVKLAAVYNSITFSTMRVGDLTTSNGGAGTVVLGAGENHINANSIEIGFTKSSGRVSFPGPNGSLFIRNQNGDGRANLTLGNGNNSGSTGNTAIGSLLLNDHPVDAMVDALTLGRRTAAGAGGGTGYLEFNNGVLDVNSIAMGFRSNGGAAAGTLNVGANATLKVGGNGILLGDSNSATAGTGMIDILGGTADIDSTISSRSAGGAAGTGSAGTLQLDGGLLELHGHSVGSSAGPVNLILNQGRAMNIGTVNDTGGVAKNGTGVLTLDGTNTYTGDTTINGGIIVLNNGAAALNSNLAPTINNAVNFAPSVGNFTVGGLTGAGNIVLADTSGAPINLNAGNNNGTQTYNGVLSGSGSLTKIGNGKLTLAANHTYSGPTTINGGTLAVSGSIASVTTTINNGGTLLVTGGLNASGNVAVNSGGLLAGNMPAGKSLGHVTLSNGGTILAGQDPSAGLLHASALDLNGGTLQFNLGVTTTSSVIDANSVNVNNSLSISVPIGASSPGVYTLVQSTSPINYAPGAALTLFGPGGGFGYTLDTTSNNKFIFLDVTGTIAHLVWTGAADNTTWDASAANWTNTDTNTPNQVYADPANVTFDDTAPSGATNINLTTTVSPTSVTFGGNNNNYTIQGGGSIGGLFTTLTKNGNTTLALLTNNNYAGGSTINGGTIQINSANNLGATTGSLTINAGTLEVLGGNSITSTRNINLGAATSAITVDGGATYTNTGVIADGAASGRLVANGSGTLALFGANSYTGGTSIGGNGTVQINSASSLGAGPVTIGSGTLDATANITSTRAVALAAPNSTIGAEANVTYAINGIISDAPSATGTLNKVGAGTIVLGATNTYTGPTNILAGTVTITSDGNLGAAPASPTPANVYLNNGVLAIGSTMTLNPNRGIGINGNGTINIAAGQTFTYAGVVADSNGSGSFGIAGAGTTILSGTSTYTGNTNASGSGTIILPAGTNHLPSTTPLSLGNTTVLVLGDANGPASQTISSLGSGGANATPSVLGNNAAVSTLTIGYNGAPANHSRGIGGPGPNQNNIAIVFNGSGTLRLNAAGGTNADNTYTGGTTIDSGTLVASQIHSFGDVSGLVTINGGTMGIESGTTPATGVAPYNVLVPDTANAGIASGRTTPASSSFLQTLGSLTIGAATLNVGQGSNINAGTASLAFSGATTLSSTAGGTVAFNTNNTDLVLGSVTGAATTGNTAILQLDGNSTSTAGNVITGTISPGPNGGNLAVVKSNSSQWTLAGDSTYTAGTIIQSGTLITNTNFSNGTLNLQGGTARVAQRQNNNESDHVTLVPAVQFNGGALDLTNNAMIIDYDPLASSPLSDVRNAVANGYSGGNWNGNGINSSTAAASSTPKTAIGYAEASTLHITNFHGYIVDGSAILLAYTANGDANLDGKVNALDFNALATSYGAGSNLWTQGDFNYDGNVDTLDFNALASNFNQSTPPPAAPSLGALVPEPWIVPTIGLLALMRRRAREKP